MLKPDRRSRYNIPQLISLAVRLPVIVTWWEGIQSPQHVRRRCPSAHPSAHRPRYCRGSSIASIYGAIFIYTVCGTIWPKWLSNAGAAVMKNTGGAERLTVLTRERPPHPTHPRHHPDQQCTNKIPSHSVEIIVLRALDRHHRRDHY